MHFKVFQLHNINTCKDLSDYFRKRLSEVVKIAANC